MFTVQDRFIWHSAECGRYRGISLRKVIIIARSQLHLATALDGQGAVAIELNFVQPISTLRQLLRPQEQHRFDECRLRLRHLAPASECSDQAQSATKKKLHYGNVRRSNSLLQIAWTSDIDRWVLAQPTRIAVYGPDEAGFDGGDRRRYADQAGLSGSVDSRPLASLG